MLSVSAIREFGKGSELSDSLGSFVRGGKTGAVGTVGTFASVDEFRQYLSQSQSSGRGAFGGGRAQAFGTMESVVAPSATKDGSSVALTHPLSTDAGGTPATGAMRVSETNVRTEGVDEPDIVKTDGSHIYFSREPRYLLYRNPQPMPMPKPTPPNVSSRPSILGTSGTSI